jgi:hypothetical protein
MANGSAMRTADRERGERSDDASRRRLVDRS